jgi:hypothetical protein
MKYIILAWVLTILLAGCGAVQLPNTTTAPPDEPPFFIGPNDGMTEVHITHENGFGIDFVLRNISGGNLYYKGGYRLYRHNGADWELYALPCTADIISHWDNLNLFIGAGTARHYTLQWGNHPILALGNTFGVSAPFMSSQIPAGRYKFEQDFYSDTVNSLYTLIFEFVSTDMSGLFTPNGGLTPIGEERMRQSNQSYIDFVRSGGTSGIIVLSGDVTATPASVSFGVTNTSADSYIYGESFSIFACNGGNWHSVPALPGNFAFIGIGHMLDGGAENQRTVNFGWMYGELAAGDYILVTEYVIDNTSGLPRDYEYLIIQFTVS